jgi:hypothetical protein
MSTTASRYAELQLAPQHERLLAASAIAPEVAKARSYRSIVRGSSVLDACGFSRDQQLLTPGLLIRLHPLLDGPSAVRHQYRPDHPRADHKGKPRKYETPPRTRLTIDAHPFLRERGWLDDPRIALLFTEGLRKVDAAISKGLCALGFLGVWGFCGTNTKGGKQVLPDLREIPVNDRLVLIGYDSDAATNPDVLKAAHELGRYIAAKGGHPQMPVIPPGPDGAKVGLDDYLAHHSREEYLALPRIDLALPMTGTGKADAADDGADDPRQAVFTSLTNVQIRTVRCAMAGWIPTAALTLIGGEPGRGKGLFSMNAAARWSRGTMPGAFLGTPVHVLIASAEDDPEAVIKPRLIAAGGDPARVSMVHIAYTELAVTRGIYLPSDITLLEPAAREVGAHVLLLDPLLSFVDARADVWKEPAVRAALLPIVAMAARLDAALIGVMHMNKRQTEEMIHRIAHSLAFAAVARSVLMIMPDPATPDDRAARVLFHAKYNLGPTAPACRFRIVGADVTEGTTEAHTAAITWGDEAPEITAAAFAAGARGPTPAQRQDAVAFLLRALAGGPRPLAIVVKEAIDAKITMGTLYRARALLRIVTVRAENGDVLWRLPEGAAH